MMFNLNEDNKSIESLIKFVDSKIINFKNKESRDKELLNKIQNMYLSIIGDWMRENYLMNIDLDEDKENLIKDKLLDLVNILDKL